MWYNYNRGWDYLIGYIIGGMVMKKNIKNAVEALGLTEKNVFTLGELEAIARKANCSVHAVMKYLRNR